MNLKRLAVTMSAGPDKESVLQESQKEGAGKEVAIQTDTHELERNSGRIPLRKRFVPLKFSDYCVFANNVKEEDEEEEDASFTVTETSSSSKTLSSCSTRGDILKKSRGRSRKVKEISTHAQETNEKQADNEETSKKVPITKVPNGFRCGMCGKIFTLRGNAKTHLVTHTDNKPFRCDFKDCGKQMRTKESLRRHKLSHLGIKLFECPDCHKKFSCNLSLQEHMTLHTGEKRLTCEVCGMKFRQVAVMKRHLTTHSEDKPFSCEICEKKFSLKIYLKSHMKTHTGEKPFSCSVCDKLFAHASDLNRHKIIHSGEKPYKCSVCSMRYSDPSSRRRHEREHENRSQFVCHLCKKEFTRAGQLRVHLVKEHSSSVGSLPTENRIPFEIKVETTQPQTLQQQIENGGVLSIIPNMLAVVDPVSKPDESSEMDFGMTVTEDKMVTKPLLLDNTSSHQFDPGKETNLVSIQHFVPEIQNAIQMFVMKMPRNSDEVTSLPANNVYKVVETEEGNQVLQLQLEDKSTFRSDLGTQDNDGKIAFTYEGETVTVLDPGQTDSLHEEHVNIIIENNGNETHNPVTNRFINTSVTTNDSENPATFLTNSDIKSVTEELKCETQPEIQEVVEVGEMSLSGNQGNILSVMVESTDCNVSISTEDGIPPNGNEIEEGNSLVISSPFIDNPDLHCQDYYNWLSNFCEECKQLNMPLSNNVFRKISRVHKTLSDFLAVPTGVISDKSSYKILMGITQDLSKITDHHLSVIFSQLNE